MITNELTKLVSGKLLSGW